MNYQGKFTSEQYNENQKEVIDQLHALIDRVNMIESETIKRNWIQKGKDAYHTLHVLKEWQLYKHLSFAQRIVIPANPVHFINANQIAPTIGLPLAMMPNSDSAWCPILDQRVVLDPNDEAQKERIQITVTNSHPAYQIYQTDPHGAWYKNEDYDDPFIQVFEFQSNQSVGAVELTYTIEFLNQIQQITNANALYIKPFASGFHLIKEIKMMKQDTWINLDPTKGMQEGMPGWIHLPEGAIQQLQITMRCEVTIDELTNKKMWIGFDEIRLYQFAFTTEGKLGLHFHLPNINGITEIQEMDNDHRLDFYLYRKTNSIFTKVESQNWSDPFEASEWAIIVHAKDVVPAEFDFKGVLVDVMPMEG